MGDFALPILPALKDCEAKGIRSDCVGRMSLNTGDCCR